MTTSSSTGLEQTRVFKQPPVGDGDQKAIRRRSDRARDLALARSGDGDLARVVDVFRLPGEYRQLERLVVPARASKRTGEGQTGAATTTRRSSRWRGKSCALLVNLPIS